MFEQADNRFIRDWLAYTGGSESPELFNLWSGIAALSACMGRRYVYREGRLTYWPNTFIILVGPPGVRKSSSGKIAKQIIRRYTPNVRFGPTDTSGKKQGLLAYYIKGWGGADDEIDEDEDTSSKPGPKPSKAEDSIVMDIATMLNPKTSQPEAQAQPAPTGKASMFGKVKQKPVEASESTEPSAPTPSDQASNPFAAVATLTNKPGADSKPTTNYGDASASDYAKLENTQRNPRELFVFADELTTFIGLNQIDMTNCLTDLYTPSDSYVYSLSKSTKRIPFPSLSILACATPIGLASHLPPASIGQGLVSRTIFVYENQSAGKVYPPPALDRKLEVKIGRLFASIAATPFDEFDAERDLIELDRTDAAFKLNKSIYENHKPELEDSRFDSYSERRHDHLCKLAMILAVGEERDELQPKDFQLAHEILLETENNMPQALGEIGMDKNTLAKQELRTYLQNSWPLGVAAKSFERNARRDLSAQDYQSFLTQLITSGDATSSSRDVNGVKVEVLVPRMPRKEKQKLERAKAKSKPDQPNQSDTVVEFNPAGKSKPNPSSAFGKAARLTPPHLQGAKKDG